MTQQVQRQKEFLTSFIDASEINISGKGTAETNTTGISGETKVRLLCHN